MGEIIRDWLRTRLGVIIELSPEIFGHYAKDGTLLAKVLHSYDVINDSQLSTLLETQDPALARVNLKHLRIWLKFVGVDCDNDCIEDISNGKGTMALRLFYKVFLSLENKDRLHFITLQREREKYIPSCSKFDVTIVSEEPITWQSKDQLLADSLKRSASLVDWKKKKYQDLLSRGDASKKRFEKFRSSQKVNEILESLLQKESVKNKSFGGAGGGGGGGLPEAAASRELDEFTKKHRVKKSPERTTTEDPCEEKEERKTSSQAPRIDQDAAKAYTKALRNKHRQEALTKSFKTRMQMNLLAELWKKVLDDQEMEFDEIIAKKVLHQSQYEKQLVRKLCEVRSEKSRMAANRMIVEKLMEDTRESELRLEQERAREVMVRENEEVEAERRRINELERKIEEQRKLRKEAELGKFGERIVLDLVDIAIKTGEYRRESNEIRVPDVLSNQWKALFLKSQPIIEPDGVLFTKDELEADQEIQHEAGNDGGGSSSTEENESRARVLNDEDFHNYQNTKLPWKDFLPDVDQEVADYLNLGLVVLGYIVHKALESLYPRYGETELVESSLPAMKTRAVVLGVPDSLLYEPIQRLLKHSKIHLVGLEEAINYCLGAYKAEMRDFEYIDLEIIAAANQVVGSSSIPSEDGTSGKKERKPEKSSSGKRKTAWSIEKLETTKTGVDKVTQTPRVIPHEDKDPSLGNAAYIGKWIHEFLTLGEPLSDDLISRTIVEYLKSLEEGIEGFVLINYPNTYNQMSCLEFALSGKRLPERMRKTLEKEDNSNIEEIAFDRVSRIIFQEAENDSESLWFESKLVPNPAKPQCSTSSVNNSCLTAFVRIKPKSGDSMKDNSDDQDIWEILSENANSVDDFYVDQEIASILYYTIFDLVTLKKLVRLIIAGRNELISRVPSQQLFGDYLNYFEGRRSDDSSSSKAPIIKRLLKSRASDISLGESSKSSDSIESRQAETSFRSSKIGSPPMPGEMMWPWANFSQSLQFLQSLANLWQNLETRYIENLKEIFHLKRIHFGGIVPYKDFVTRHMREFIDRPDKKQDFLHEFHRAFNDIDETIRDNLDVKKELHCRIDDFQTKLWDICDSRRREAQDERKRVILEHWLTFEMINLSNVYIDILQAEIDRCSDTLQFINDYYTSALQRPLQEVRFSPQLRKILFQDPTSDSKEETSAPSRNYSTKNLEAKEWSKEQPFIKISLSNVSEAPSPPEERLFKEETLKVLVNANQEPFYPAQTLSYKTIEANIQYVRKILESLASRILENLRKEESSDVRSSSRKSGGGGGGGGGQEIENKQLQNLFLEWRYAFMYEINRIRVRLKMLDASSRHDINYLIDGMRRAFSDIQNDILERYNREIKSVDEMANVFRFAVEEATPIQEELLLDADRFLVRSNVLMFPDESQVTRRRRRSRRSFILQHSLPARFTIPMLSRLVEIFRRAAPSGIISERSFVYILQDLLVFGGNETSGKHGAALPSSWSKLRACDVGRLVNELFGDEDTIDWREFIIYATDIEMPNLDEILNDFRSLKSIDDKAQEFVSRQDFLSIGFWFCADEVNSCRQADLSNGSLQRYIESEEDIIAEMKLDRNSNFKNNSNIEENEMKSEETPRPGMLKRLFCDVFSYGNENVNYVAFLMAFCKDEKPEVGFGKALCLAIDDVICIDWEEGEEYVRELIENQRESITARSTGSDNRSEATQASTAILDHLLEKVFRLAASRFEEPTENDRLPREENGSFRKRPVTIEKLDFSEKSVLSENDRLSEKKISISVHSEATERKNRGLSVTISEPEKMNESEKISQSVESAAVHWLNFQVLHTVLAAMLPSHAIQENLLGSGRSLYENLELVYHELGGKETTDDSEEMILAHRFLHHDFVKKLLADATKFTTKRLGTIINEITTHRYKYSTEGH